MCMKVMKALMNMMMDRLPNLQREVSIVKNQGGYFEYQ
jgi:hypothetical protein